MLREPGSLAVHPGPAELHLSQEALYVLPSHISLSSPPVSPQCQRLERVPGPVGCWLHGGRSPRCPRSGASGRGLLHPLLCWPVGTRTHQPGELLILLRLRLGLNLHLQPRWSQGGRGARVPSCGPLTPAALGTAPLVVWGRLVCLCLKFPDCGFDVRAGLLMGGLAGRSLCTNAPVWQCPWKSPGRDTDSPLKDAWL